MNGPVAYVQVHICSMCTPICDCVDNLVRMNYVSCTSKTHTHTHTHTCIPITINEVQIVQLRSTHQYCCGADAGTDTKTLQRLFDLLAREVRAPSRPLPSTTTALRYEKSLVGPVCCAVKHKCTLDFATALVDHADCSNSPASQCQKYLPVPVSAHHIRS